MNWAGLAVGALIGFALSLAVWWVQYRVLVPGMAFGDGISKLSNASGVVYRLKIQNGRRRGIIDLTVDVRVFFPSAVVEYSEAPRRRSTASLSITTPNRRIMRLGPGQNRMIRLDLRNATWEPYNPGLLRALAIDPRAAGATSLEHILSADPDAYLRVRVLAYDEFSGSRKFFESPKYSPADVVIGTFHGLRLRPAQPLAPTSETAPEGLVIEAAGDSRLLATDLGAGGHPQRQDENNT
jgi:hypothetical protein